MVKAGIQSGVILTLAQELSDNAMAQVSKAELVDNNFLLGISLQFQDFAYGMKLDIPARIPSTILTNEYRST